MVTFLVVVVAAFLVGAMVGAWIVMDLSQASGSVVATQHAESRERAEKSDPLPAPSPAPVAKGCVGRVGGKDRT